MKHSSNAQFSLLGGTSVLRQDIPKVPVFLKVFNISEAVIKRRILIIAFIEKNVDILCIESSDFAAADLLC